MAFQYSLKIIGMFLVMILVFQFSFNVFFFLRYKISTEWELCKGWKYVEKQQIFAYKFKISY